MSVITRVRGGRAATMVDGFLPPREQLVQNIRQCDPYTFEFDPSDLDYSDEETWDRDKIFETAAALITCDFHKGNDKYGYHPLCHTRLADIKTSNFPGLCLPPETNKADDYRHIITVHGGKEEAHECMQYLLGSLGFEDMPDVAHQDYGRFVTDSEKILTTVLKVYTSPHQVIKDILSGVGVHLLDIVR